MINKIINNLFNNKNKSNIDNNNKTKETVKEILDWWNFYKYFWKNLKNILFIKQKIHSLEKDTKNEIIKLSKNENKQSLFNSKRILLNRKINDFKELSKSYIIFIEDEIKLIKKEFHKLKYNNQEKDIKIFEDKILLIEKNLEDIKKNINKKELWLRNFIS